MKHIDNILNSQTMYRVVLIALVIISFSTLLLALVGKYPFTPGQAIVSLFLVTISCQVFNQLFSRILKVHANKESSIITGLIVYLLFYPAGNWDQIGFLVLTSFIAIAGKYIFSKNNKNLFNPVALSAFILGFWPDTSSVWWVSSKEMFPVLLVLGLMIVRKTRKEFMFISFVVSALVIGSLNSISPLTILVSWPILFLGSVMLTEPTTTPPTRNFQIIYGIIVGSLFTSKLHFGQFFTTPEVSLLIGNVFSYIVSNKYRYRLKFIEKVSEASGTYTFRFNSKFPVKFTPGQYAEFTLKDENSDSRGNRRFFTIASPPGNDVVEIGVKIFENSSWFKKRLVNLSPGEEIVMSQISGDFTATNLGEKYVFIAGGIGITPFRSIVSNFINTNTKIDATLLYFNSDDNVIPYKDFFIKARKLVGLKTDFLSTRITSEDLKKLIPDYLNRKFYLSGPSSMVDGYKKLLQEIGVSNSVIKTDYFPGF